MPNIKSAKKRVQVSGVRNERNKADKSALKTALKKFEAAAAEGNRTEAEGTYKVAGKAIDKAAAKGLLHKNNAAHKKSALTLKLNKIGCCTKLTGYPKGCPFCFVRRAVPPAGSSQQHKKTPAAQQRESIMF